MTTIKKYNTTELNLPVGSYITCIRLYDTDEDRYPMLRRVTAWSLTLLNTSINKMTRIIWRKTTFEEEKIKKRYVLRQEEKLLLTIEYKVTKDDSYCPPFGIKLGVVYE